MDRAQFLKSHIILPTGYGELTRNFARALQQNGFHVEIYNDTPTEPIFPGFPEIDRLRPEVPVIYVCFHHNLYVIPEGQLAVVRTMFETDRLHPKWAGKVDRADAIWVPSRFNLKSFSRSGIPREKIQVVCDPLDTKIEFPSGFPFKTRKKFKFLSIFNGVVWYRKGADVLLRAYCQAFTALDDVCLVIKTDMSRQQLLDIAGLHGRRQDPEIEIIRQHLTDQEMLSLYSGADAYVLPSRGEGIGRPYLYAMLKGLPVIATGWSGNTQFLKESNAYLARYRLKPIPWDLEKLVYPLNYGYRYAEPNEQHVMELMSFVYTYPEAAHKKAMNGQQEVLTHHSYAAVASQTRKALSQLKPTGSRRSLIPEDIFLNMYPLYFPGSDGDLQELDRQFSSQPLKRVAIYGTGQGGELAYQWVKRFQNVEKIVFLDRERKTQEFQRCEVYDYKSFDYSSVQVVLLGLATFFVPPVLENLKQVCSAPVYFFGA